MAATNKPKSESVRTVASCVNYSGKFKQDRITDISFHRCVQECLISEMTVAKNVVLKNIGSDDNIKIEDVKRVLSENQTTFPNLQKRQKLFTIGFHIKPCGLFMDKDYPYLAASPDGIIDDHKIIEIKAPYAAKDTLNI